jgi:hypothetical protein
MFLEIESVDLHSKDLKKPPIDFYSLIPTRNIKNQDKTQN